MAAVAGDISKAESSSTPTSTSPNPATSTTTPPPANTNKPPVYNRPLPKAPQQVGAKNQEPAKDNITGVGGMSRMGATVSVPPTNVNNHPNAKKVKTRKEAEMENLQGCTLSNPVKTRTLADVLAEKRRKNHQQMKEARIINTESKVPLREALDNMQYDLPDHGPKKPSEY